MIDEAVDYRYKCINMSYNRARQPFANCQIKLRPFDV